MTLMTASLMERIAQILSQISSGVIIAVCLIIFLLEVL
jgi:hypothetical protein